MAVVQVNGTGPRHHLAASDAEGRGRPEDGRSASSAARMWGAGESMARIDDGALENLRELLGEIAPRAGRLNGRRGLEGRLGNPARQSDEIDTAAGPPAARDPDVKGRISWDIAEPSGVGSRRFRRDRPAHRRRAAARRGQQRGRPSRDERKRLMREGVKVLGELPRRVRDRLPPA